ncbi:MAG: 4'-phosphopantetheinyl transferase superfamily protein [Bacteroidetes bacterium]|nr:4'-phosphopantetheinyl transferase superfamily protein [Bacteroidota bacterium]
MPLFYQHNINENTRLGIWQIEEDESFFLKKVPLKKNVSHPHKRLQHLAGRFLLPELFNDFPIEEIIIADTKKPFLENEKYHFSISHCGDFAAAIVSGKSRVGVDVEMVTPKIGRISHKFLAPHEHEFLERVSLPEDLIKMQTLFWSAKESIFKWYSLGEVDFREYIQLRENVPSTQDTELILPFVFKKSSPIHLMVHAKIFGELILTWVV